MYEGSINSAWEADAHKAHLVKTQRLEFLMGSAGAGAYIGIGDVLIGLPLLAGLIHLAGGIWLTLGTLIGGAAFMALACGAQFDSSNHVSFAPIVMPVCVKAGRSSK